MVLEDISFMIKESLFASLKSRSILSIEEVVLVSGSFTDTGLPYESTVDPFVDLLGLFLHDY